MINVENFGVLANHKAEDGQIKTAISHLSLGEELLFPGIRGQEQSVYTLFYPIYLDKDIKIVGGSPGVVIELLGPGSVFNITSSVTNKPIYLSVNNITLKGGDYQIYVSSTVALCKLQSVVFKEARNTAVYWNSPGLNLSCENLLFTGCYAGLQLNSDTNYDFFNLEKSEFVNVETVGVSYTKNVATMSGSVSISNVAFVGCNDGIVVDNVRYYESNVEYINIGSNNYVLSGTSQRLTGSGAGGGGGVTAHGALTGLAVDDHKQYLHVSGTRAMSANLDMGGHQITNVGNVDGVDISGMDIVLDAHIVDVNNPHATSIGNLDAGTLAELNAAISDGNIVSEAQFGIHTASILSFTGTIQQHTASIQSFSATLLNASSSFVSNQNLLFSASGTFRSELTTQTGSITSLFAASGTFRGELNSLTSTVVRLDAASGTFRTELTNVNATVVGLVVTSGSYSAQLNALTTSVSRIDAASGTFRSELTALTATVTRLDFASGTFNIISSSYDKTSGSFVGFSSSHSSRHLSGGADPIDAQSLRGNGLATDRLLISNGLGGWTTVASQSVGSAGGSSPTSITYLTCSTGGDKYSASGLFGNGSADFVFAVWYRPIAPITNTVYNIASARNGSNGWRIALNFGGVQVVMADGAGANFGPDNMGGSIYYSNLGYIQERDALILMRVYSATAANTGSMHVYINGAYLLEGIAAGNGVTPGTVPLTLGGDVGFGNTMIGGIQGAAYYSGTVTDLQIKDFMISSMDAGRIVPANISWNGLWSITGSAGIGSVLFDQTGNGNHLVATGTMGNMQRVIRLA